MKTAIVINGHVRTWEKCKDNFIDTFGDLNADVFVSVYNKQFEYAEYIRSIQDFYGENILEENDIKRMFEGINLKKIVIDNSEEMQSIVAKEKENVKLQFNTQAHGKDIFISIYPQYRKLYYIMKDVAKYEEENNFKYDRIIKTRTEVIYHPEVFKRAYSILGDNEILVDAGAVPLNDVMYACSRDNMYKIVDFLYNEFFDPKFPEHDVHWPPHSMLKIGVESNNIGVVSRRLFKHIEREKLQQVY